MQAHIPASQNEIERDQLRALIEQQTKEFEAKNGSIETLGIVKKYAEGALLETAPVRPSHSGEAFGQCKINSAIRKRYANTACLKTFAKELGISVSTLYSRASQIGVRRKHLGPKPSAEQLAQRAARAAND